MASKRKATTRKNSPSIKAHGIENLGVAVTAAFGGAIHNAEVVTSASSLILSNPLDYTDELTKANPFWGGVALRVLCSAVGYAAVNAVLWDYRKRNKAPAITSSIDWLNDSIAEIKAKEESDKNFEEQGHSKLPFVDGHQLIGAYKHLFMLVTSSGDDSNGNFALPSPSVLYDGMRQREKDRSEVLAAYESFEMERFKDSPNYEYTKARLVENKKKNDERAIRKAQDEINHIHEELSAVRYEVFTDGVWARLPLHMQFRIMRSVHKQIISAIANEMEKPADERLHLEALNTLGETVLLELEMADREPEVRLAFEKKVLDPDRHGLMKSVAIVV